MNSPAVWLGLPLDWGECLMSLLYLIVPWGEWLLFNISGGGGGKSYDKTKEDLVTRGGGGEGVSNINLLSTIRQRWRLVSFGCQFLKLLPKLSQDFAQSSIQLTTPKPLHPSFPTPPSKKYMSLNNSNTLEIKPSYSNLKTLSMSL